MNNIFIVTMACMIACHDRSKTIVFTQYSRQNVNVLYDYILEIQ